MIGNVMITSCSSWRRRRRNNINRMWPLDSSNGFDLVHFLDRRGESQEGVLCLDSCDYGLMRNGETTRQAKPKESHNSSERLTLIADLFAIR